MKYVFLDTETTSLDEETGELWEIATIVRDLSNNSGDREYWWQVRPDMSTADPNSLRIGRYYERAKMLHRGIGDGVELAPADAVPDEAGDFETNIYDRMAKRGDVIERLIGEEIAYKLAKQLDGATIVANNPRHDRDFIKKFLRKHGQALTASHRMIDIRSLALGWLYGRIHDCKVTEAFAPDVLLYALDYLEGVSDRLDWRVFGIDPDEYETHTAPDDARLVRDVFDAIQSGTKEITR